MARSGTFTFVTHEGLATGTLTTGSPPERTGLCNDALKRCAYKPGWALWVDGDSYARWTQVPYRYVDTMSRRVLRVRAWVVDSNDHARHVEITHSFEVPETEVEDEDRFIRWVAHCLQAVERHECREFFMVDGRRHQDPHRDDNRRLYD